MAPLKYDQIKKDFDESLGYIRSDINVIRSGRATVNYTVALLIGCGCEMLAAATEKRSSAGKIFGELLPAGDWRILANKLYTALRDGLAHGFDTKHLEIDGDRIQIYISWTQPQELRLVTESGQAKLFIGVQPLAASLSSKIDELEELLKKDESARVRFRAAHNHEKFTRFNKEETAAWHRLVGVDAGQPATR